MAAASPSKPQEIYNVLRDEVLRGQYRPGERLPSERDLASRFETSRGTVREAFKKLEQLGVATIQPGGARVVPIEDCTLDLLGPLLDLGNVPNPELIDQALTAAAKYLANRADEREVDFVARRDTSRPAEHPTRKHGDGRGHRGHTQEFPSVDSAF